ncbi:MAG TPA: pyridoxamine 5'-phosphate oxidase family protein [Actinoplanes sp.]|nr:pyridoxamine 5'-phosphate oxidase family protein [Actinoplanes sp.]
MTEPGDGAAGSGSGAGAAAPGSAPPAPRSLAQRKADTVAKLGTPAIDVWVASASGSDPHLVPLSLAWLDDRVVVAVDASSRTARNVTARGGARLALGPTRDVVMIDAVLERVVPAADPGSLAEGYARQADWDPRDAGGGYVYLVLRPDRIQAWRESNELAGRTLMRNGRWLA